MSDFTEQIRAAWQPSEAAIEAFCAARYKGWWETAPERQREMVRKDARHDCYAAYAADAPRIAAALEEAHLQGLLESDGRSEGMVRALAELLEAK